MAHEYQTNLAHINPMHIRDLLNSVLRLYFCVCGIPIAIVYQYDKDTPELLLQDFDDLISLLEESNDGIPEIRRGGGLRLMVERLEGENVPITERNP